jgi:UDP-GlcNAc:undecaprenyl-phosphate GlcNAc-1-phosphate transferase
VGLGTLLSVLLAAYLYRFEGFSRVVFALDALLLTVAVLATRAFFPAMDMVASARNKRSRRMLVYGAGAFGRLLVREMRANPDWQMNPVAFIDDDPAKLRQWIEGVPVRGALEVLDSVLRAHQVNEVIVSSLSVSDDVEQQIRSVCSDLQLPVRRLKMEIS